MFTGDSPCHNYRVQLDSRKDGFTVNLVSKGSHQAWAADFTVSSVAALTEQAGVPRTVPEFVGLLCLGLEQGSPAVAVEVCTYAGLLAKMDAAEAAASSSVNQTKRYLLIDYTSEVHGRALYVLPLPLCPDGRAGPVPEADGDVPQLEAENKRLADENQALRKSYDKLLKEMKALKVWHAELDDMNKGLMQHMKKDCEELANGFRTSLSQQDFASELKALKGRLRAEQEYSRRLEVQLHYYKHELPGSRPYRSRTPPLRRASPLGRTPSDPAMAAGYGHRPRASQAESNGARRLDRLAVRSRSNSPSYGHVPARHGSANSGHSSQSPPAWHRTSRPTHRQYGGRAAAGGGLRPWGSRSRSASPAPDSPRPAWRGGGAAAAPRAEAVQAAHAGGRASGRYRTGSAGSDSSCSYDRRPGSVGSNSSNRSPTYRRPSGAHGASGRSGAKRLPHASTPPAAAKPPLTRSTGRLRHSTGGSGAIHAETQRGPSDVDLEDDLEFARLYSTRRFAEGL